MVWSGKGRSGIGDTSIQGTWEDWDGLSPNGRQYKNKITQETRNLSGADYWHTRKADYPRQLPDESKLFLANGKANLAMFADEETPTKKKTGTLTAYDKIMQDERKYDELEELSLALDKQYLDMQIDDEQYHSAKSVIEDKMYKQWQKLAKAKNWKYDPVYDSIENPNQPVEVDRNIQLEKPVGFWQYVFNGLDDSNLFKQIYCKLEGI